MNPQNISSSFLTATGHIRAMRGGAQSHMLTASDGHAYVVKFTNNPQSVRVLANEWLGNCDGRQVAFCRRETNRNFRVHFIDFGYCFNAEEWTFPDTTTRGIYARRCVYQDVRGWQSFEPWLSQIESFDLLTLWGIAADVPPEWVEPERLAQLVECIDARRKRVRELIAAVHQSPHNPFGAWTEVKP